MDYIKSLEADLEKGYSKSDLEKLIGLPKNNLSGILKGDRKLSKKSKLKIDDWNKSEKPNPLSVYWVKEFSDGMQPVKGMESFEYKPTLSAKPISPPVAGNTVSVTIKAEDHFTAQKEQSEILERIAEIEKTLLMPQKYLPYNKRTILEAELNQLKFKI